MTKIFLEGFIAGWLTAGLICAGLAPLALVIAQKRTKNTIEGNWR